MKTENFCFRALTVVVNVYVAAVILAALALFFWPFAAIVMAICNIVLWDGTIALCVLIVAAIIACEIPPMIEKFRAWQDAIRRLGE